LDGKSMFETTRAAERLSAAAVARAYRDRDTVEKFMESIKDVVRLRPHYVTPNNTCVRVCSSAC
jgi:transposase